MTTITIHSEAIESAIQDDSRDCPVGRTLQWLCGPGVEVRVGKRSVELRRTVRIGNTPHRESRYKTLRLPKRLIEAIAEYDRTGVFESGREFRLAIPPEYLRRGDTQ